MANRDIPSSYDLLPERVRKSGLIAALARAARKDGTSGFDYFAHLGRLKDEIAPQLERIPELFPEYTPHGFESHVVRLFRIADEVLGERLFKQLNSMELFVLAAGLFAHDWGMAIGESEREALRQGGKEGGSLALLNNERDLVHAFAVETGSEIAGDGSLPRLNDLQLAEYVRRTHALRSGVRVRQLLSGVDPAVAEAVAFVCEGHWFDLKDIRRRHVERPEDVLLHSEVPLATTAIYVRIVDMFDIARDRTPSSLKDFKKPSEEISKLEWAKHHALSPIKCKSAGRLRQILIQGTVCDPEVWAALQDQKRWIDEQFGEGMDFLLHHRPDRLPCDLDSRIQWDIKPQGFKPINIRFEFNRKRVFQYLGDELYDGEPKVFLRELLQNAIDAARIRCACQQRQEPAQSYDPLIKFTITPLAGGDTLVRCLDNGIGMDEYIARNYLAKVGESYQGSSDFRKLGANVNLIARFGIGFLSCFTVAERVEIRTRRYAPPGGNSQALRLVIQGVDRQFSCFEDENFNGFGTEVSVYVLRKLCVASRNRGRKESNFSRYLGPEDHSFQGLDARAYLSSVARFVEVPVLVEETKHCTLVLKPEEDAAALLKRKKIEADVVQLSPEAIQQHWRSVLHHTGLSRAVTIKLYSLDRDLGIDLAEGFLHFAIPAEGFVFVRNPEGDGPTLVQKSDGVILGDISFKMPKGKALYSLLSEDCVCYDGILVNDPEATMTFFGRESEREMKSIFARRKLGVVRAQINLFPTPETSLAIARDRFAQQPLEEYRKIQDAFFTRIILPQLEKAEGSSPLDQLITLAHLLANYSLDPREIARRIHQDNCPIPIYNQSNGWGVLSSEDLSEETLWTIPKCLTQPFAESLRQWWAPSIFGRNPLPAWQGLYPLVFSGVGIAAHVGLDLALELASFYLASHYDIIGLRLLTPPKGNQPPLLSYGIRSKSFRPDVDINAEQVLSKAITDPPSLTVYEWKTFWKKLFEVRSATTSPLFWMANRTVAWPDGLGFVAYGNFMYNPRHPAIKWLVQCGAACVLNALKKNTSQDYCALKEALLAVNLDDIGDEDRVTLPARWSALQGASRKIPELADFQEVPLPSMEDYVPGTLVIGEDGPEFLDLDEIFADTSFEKPFGADWKP